MSTLENQVNNLRLTADIISKRGVTSGDIAIIEIRLREAADTIESLRDRLQEVGDQTCHATQPNYEHCKYSTNRGWRDTSRYSELFGTPERAAHAWHERDWSIASSELRERRDKHPKMYVNYGWPGGSYMVTAAMAEDDTREFARQLAKLRVEGED